MEARNRKPVVRNRSGRRYTRPQPFEVRLKAVKLYVEDGLPADVVAEEAGVCSGTIHEWAKRYREEGEAGLVPRGYGHRTKNKPSAAKQKAVELKKKDPSQGSKRISQVLRRFFCLKASPETIRKTLQEEQLIQKPRKKPKRNPSRPRFFERATPNQMWQSDIFTFRLGGKQAYLIGFMDDYSRYITGLRLYRAQTAAHVLEVYRRAIGEYGVPKEMLTDNGRQYTNWRGQSRFEKELKRDRVKHIRSTPHHPMTLGKLERFWKTVFSEFLGRAQFDSFEEAEERIRLWVKYYNHKRPHQGIQGLCPADRFYEIATELRQTVERGIQDNVLEMALRGKPRQPFYMVGRMGDQSVVIRAEKGKVRMLVDDEKKDQELVYELEESESHGNEEKQQESGDEAAEAGVQRQGEERGGVESVVGTAEALGSVQGAGDQLGDAEPLAEHGVDSDAGGAEAEDAAGAGTGAGPGPEAGEDAAEGEPEGAEAVEAGEPAGEDPAGAEESLKEGAFPANGYALLTAEEARMVAEFLAEKRAEAEGRSHDGQEELEPSGGGSPEAGGADPEGAQRADDSSGRGPGAGSEPQDLLQVGEAGALGDDRGAERPALRATVGAGRWAEGSDEGGDRWVEEGAAVV